MMVGTIFEQPPDNRTIKKRLCDYLSLGLHFAGEIAFVGYAATGVVQVVPGNNLEPLFREGGKGLLIYLFTQPPAFYFKGLSLTREENYHMARKHVRMSREEFSFLNRQMAKMHLYFAKKMKKN
ncbi:MAG: hypothetical protein NT076_05785 [Candidatus Pacearchaeota archaeon]|nr:hypothetical protein [Candidatus Pacearchaeota archaeon]